MRKFESPLDRSLREARERGDFDDLPQHGKPIKVKVNPLTGDIAQQLLDDAECDPPWLEAQRELDYLLGEARQIFLRSLRSINQQRAALATAEPTLRAERQININQRAERAHNRFAEAIAAINKKIFDYNLIAPDLQIQRLKIDLDTEIQTLTAQAAT